MMDEDKTREQLIEELSNLRKRVSTLGKKWRDGDTLGQNSYRQIESRLLDFFELVPAIVFEMDVDGNITFANQVATKTFGYM